MIVRPTLHEPNLELPREEPPSVWRTIKRYSNRKLYDTQSSRYVTLLQIAEMVRAGEEIRIIDNQTHEDKTEVTFALIISEQLKVRAAEGSALGLLKALICNAPGANAAPGTAAPRTSAAARTSAAPGTSAESPRAESIPAPTLAPDAASPGAVAGNGPAHTAHTAGNGHSHPAAAGGSVTVSAEWTAPFEQWRASFERRIAQLPDAEASVLRSHVQDLNDRLIELQRRVAIPRE